MDIKVPGIGCIKCKTTLKQIEEVAAAQGLAVKLEKIEDIHAIMGYSVVPTPGVAVDGQVVHAGGAPSRDKVAGGLAGAPSAPQAATAGNCCSGGKCC